MLIEVKYIYAVYDEKELNEGMSFVARSKEVLKNYADWLRTTYEVQEIPKFLVIANLEAATQVLSELPIPAYTNEERIVLTPSLAVWRDIYLKQLESYERTPETEAAYTHVEEYYENCLDENHILQLIGHELMHHSEWFLDDFADDRVSGIWFEEGMAEYVSKSYFLTAKQFEQEKEVNRLLLELFEARFGRPSLEDFGASTYGGAYAEIFYYYWRSFLTVDELLDKYGDIESVFEVYRAWDRAGRRRSLSQYFGVED